MAKKPAPAEASAPVEPKKPKVKMVELVKVVREKKMVQAVGEDGKPILKDKQPLMIPKVIGEKKVKINVPEAMVEELLKKDPRFSKA